MEVVQDVLVGLFPIVVMLSVGVDLTVQRLLIVFRRPKTLAVGLSLNHLAIPLVALAISNLLALSPACATGFLLCAAAPGGPIGAMLTQRAKGDLAFAVSLLVVMTVVNTITTPLLLVTLIDVDLGGGTYSHVPAIVRTIVLYLIVPLAVGIAVRHWLPSAADRALKILKIATNILFGLLFVGIIAARWQLIFEIGARPFLAMIICVIICVSSGYLVAGRDPGVRAALALNTGIRNISLSLLLANLWFEDDATLVTVMTYGMCMITISTPVALWVRSRGRG